MDLLRWWRFLQAVSVSWDRASRVEARDFSRWIQLTAKPGRSKTPKRRAVSSGTGPNPVTGKPTFAPGYAPTTVAHSETVLRRFYDIHRDAGTGVPGRHDNAPRLPGLPGSHRSTPRRGWQGGRACRSGLRCW
ncbi:hypothetical protein AB0D98_19220 [Streptomyces sp. NPDC047987]|uniref:hypothetical protein n=1 Tax=unclassified Streptomyces TaxID=2593676 RepID=UPI0034180687